MCFRSSDTPTPRRNVPASTGNKGSALTCSCVPRSIHEHCALTVNGQITSSQEFDQNKLNKEVKISNHVVQS